MVEHSRTMVQSPCNTPGQWDLVRPVHHDVIRVSAGDSDTGWDNSEVDIVWPQQLSFSLLHRHLFGTNNPLGVKMPLDSDSQEERIKAVIIGDGAEGKSSFLSRLWDTDPIVEFEPQVFETFLDSMNFGSMNESKR